MTDAEKRWEDFKSKILNACHSLRPKEKHRGAGAGSHLGKKKYQVKSLGAAQLRNFTIRPPESN
jgi:hypothetical protein